MTYEEFQNRKSFSKEELLACAHGNLFNDAPPEFSLQLQLNAQQKKRVTEIANAASKALNAIYQDHPHADMETITNLCLKQIGKTWQQVEELLSDEQKKKWVKINAEVVDLVPVNTQADVN